MLTSTDPARRRAALYALVHRGTPGDVGFYVDQCRSAASVLEIGCGAGRLLAPLAELGGRLVGVDIDRGMLAAASDALPPTHRDRVRLLRADMRRLALEETFDRVIIPYNTLFALPSDEDQIAALVTARRHLAPGGLLLFDLYVDRGSQLDFEFAQEDSDFEHLITVVSEGQRVDIFDREVPRPTPRSFRMEYRYELHPPDGGSALIVEDAINHHYLPPGLVQTLLERAGCQLVDVCGDFRGGRLTPESEVMVVRARAQAR